MTPRFFIDRPIFATVLSVMITLAGVLAVGTLPVSQYPQVTPPTIQVDCNYPGANAQIVADTIAAPIEQQVNGVEDMLYMASQATSDGSYTLTVTFKIGTNLNLSQIRVLNRVALAYPQLPDVVRATGVTTRKRSSEILLTIALSSPDRSYDQLYLSNYAVIRLREELSRLPGVSDVLVFGQRDYAMRLWINPQQLSSRGLTAVDVIDAIKQQNTPLVAGQLGLPPVGEGLSFQFPITGVGRLTTVEDFEGIVVKVGAQGQQVRVKDVARVELGAKVQDVSNMFDNKPTVGLAIFLLADANALEARDVIGAKMDEMAKDFPAGIAYEIGYDTTPFIRESIHEVFKSLWASIALVAVVVLIFLQSWRAAIIPLAAVPVAIVGTFAAMAALGYSINNLTLFGLVLAVGIVVDDAIVVVEAVQHQLEKGYAPREATIHAMEQVAGPVMAVGVVLSAVFIPCAFLSGIVGQFFRQFAVTIAVSTMISTFNSLTLSPALCALLLRPKGLSEAREPFPRILFVLIGAGLGALLLHSPTGRVLGRLPEGWQGWLAHSRAWLVPVVGGVAGAVVGWLLRVVVNRGLGLFFRGFNSGFSWCGRTYVRIVGTALRLPIVVLAVYSIMLVVGVVGYSYLPIGFIPQQDKGYLIGSIQLPDAASVERTRDAIERITKTLLDYEMLVAAHEGDAGAEQLTAPLHRSCRKPKPNETVNVFQAGEWVRRVRPVAHVNSVSGNSFVLSAYGSNFGSMFIILKGFDERREGNLYYDEIRTEILAKLDSEVPEAQVAVFGAAAVSGLGRAGGFRIMIEDRGDVGPKALQEQTDNFLKKSRSLPQVTGLFSVYKIDSPQVFVDVDRVACLSKGVALADVNTVLQASMGARYVNDFNQFGRTWQVSVQGDLRFRDEMEDIRRLKVRNRNGGMVPLASVVKVRETGSPLVISRYNMYVAASINGNVAAGMSTGDARAALVSLAEQELPTSMGVEWTELAYIEELAGRSELRIPGVYTFRGDTTVLVFGLSVAFVFLVLAALYESWAFPLAVILVVPVCVVWSLGAVWITDPGSMMATVNEWRASWWIKPGSWADGPARWLDAHVVKGANGLIRNAGVRKGDVNIFTQVGFVVLIGLACKNAILIVEFARVARNKGAELRTSILDACKLRFRPILMTSVAFILGVLPLAVATGAGSEMRQALGIAVLGGMAGVTLFGIFFTPIFFALVDKLTNSTLFANRWVRAVSDSVLYVLGFRFVRPLAGIVLAAGSGIRKVTKRKFGA